MQSAALILAKNLKMAFAIHLVFFVELMQILTLLVVGVVAVWVWRWGGGGVVASSLFGFGGGAVASFS